MANRVTQQPAEVLTEAPVAAAKVTQQTAETLTEAPSAAVKVTQDIAEATTVDTHPVRVTQFLGEALVSIASNLEHKFVVMAN